MASPWRFRLVLATLLAFGLGLAGLSGPAHAAMIICSGLDTNNEFNDDLCDYTEINAFFGLSLTSNADLIPIAKDDDPENPGVGGGGFGNIEITSVSPPEPVVWEQVGGAQPLLWVHKYDRIYDVYSFMGPGSGGSGTVADPWTDSATRPDHTAFCSQPGNNCNPQAATSHVATYATTVVPEPGTLFLLGSGLVGAGAWARRRGMRRHGRDA